MVSLDNHQLRFQALQACHPVLLLPEHYNRDMTGLKIMPYLPAHFITIHYGHHYITNDQIRNDLICNLQTFFPMFSFYHSVNILKLFYKIISEVDALFNYQYDPGICIYGNDPSLYRYPGSSGMKSYAPAVPVRFPAGSGVCFLIKVGS